MSIHFLKTTLEHSQSTIKLVSPKTKVRKNNHPFIAIVPTTPVSQYVQTYYIRIRKTITPTNIKASGWVQSWYSNFPWQLARFVICKNINVLKITVK